MADEVKFFEPQEVKILARGKPQGAKRDNMGSGAR